jgi:hypothetical protein
MEENLTPTQSHAGFTFMSAEIGEISQALSNFQGDIEQPKLEKEVKVTMKSGGKYSFKYADLSACAKAAAPYLKANSLAVTQLISDGKLITILSHKSGQWIKSTLLLPQQTNDYQSYGSAITYLKRYSYCAILGIVADTDDDANMACGNQADIKPATPAKTAPTYTDAQLQQALAELAAATKREDVKMLWEKWQATAPAMCKNGTMFYKAIESKLNTFKNS